MKVFLELPARAQFLYGRLIASDLFSDSAFENKSHLSRSRVAHAISEARVAM